MKLNPRNILKQLKWRIRDYIVKRLRKANYKIYAPFRQYPTEEEKSRFAYQCSILLSQIKPGDRVLDIGSGHEPNPLATILSDRFVGDTIHRSRPLKRDGRPLLQMDIEHIPFQDKSVDFVICSHILEHVANPVACCREIMRVGRAGYIETPTLMKDALFGWARKTGHRWHIQAVHNHLVFFEYTDRQLEGLGTEFFREAIFGIHEHPLQDVFSKNNDLLNVQLTWKNSFNCHVYYLDGRYESFRADQLK